MIPARKDVRAFLNNNAALFIPFATTSKLTASDVDGQELYLGDYVEIVASGRDQDAGKRGWIVRIDLIEDRSQHRAGKQFVVHVVPDGWTPVTYVTKTPIDSVSRHSTRLRRAEPQKAPPEGFKTQDDPPPFQVGDVVRFKGRRRRYVLTDVTAWTGRVSMTALSGGTRGGGPSNEPYSEVELDDDQTISFSGKNAWKLEDFWNNALFSGAAQAVMTGQVWETKDGRFVEIASISQLGRMLSPKSVVMVHFRDIDEYGPLPLGDLFRLASTRVQARRLNAPVGDSNG